MLTSGTSGDWKDTRTSAADALPADRSGAQAFSEYVNVLETSWRMRCSADHRPGAADRPAIFTSLKLPGKIHYAISPG